MTITKSEYLDGFIGVIEEWRDRIGDDTSPDIQSVTLPIIKQALVPFSLAQAIGVLEMVKLTLLLKDLPESYWPKPDVLKQT